MSQPTKFEDIACCPPLDTSPVCDVIDMRRRLVFPTKVRAANEQAVKVEVILHTRFTRCSAFESPTAVTCGRRCVNSAFRRQWVPSVGH